jgi:hypothetical protein
MTTHVVLSSVSWSNCSIDCREIFCMTLCLVTSRCTVNVFYLPHPPFRSVLSYPVLFCSVRRDGRLWYRPVIGATSSQWMCSSAEEQTSTSRMKWVGPTADADTAMWWDGMGCDVMWFLIQQCLLIVLCKGFASHRIPSYPILSHGISPHHCLPSDLTAHVTISSPLIFPPLLFSVRTARTP